MNLPKIEVRDIDPTVADIGKLLGFFVPSGDDELSVDVGIFEKPFSSTYLEGIPERAGVLVDLLSRILPTPLPEGPDGSVPPNSQWFPILHSVTATHQGADGAQNDAAANDQDKKVPSGVYVVLPKDHTTERAVLGVGLWTQVKLLDDAVTITPFAYFPLVAVGPTDISFVLGAKDNPIEVGVKIQGPQGHFKGRELSLGGVDFSARIFLDGTPPSFAVHLIDTEPPIAPTYTKVEELIAHGGTAVEYINAAISSGPVTELLNIPIAGEGANAVTAGSALQAVGLLEPVEGPAQAMAGPAYQLVNLQQFVDQDAVTIVERFLFEGLNVLVTALGNKPIVPIRIKGVDHGGIFLVKETSKDGSTTDFGLRVAVTDLQITGQTDNTPGDGVAQALVDPTANNGTARPTPELILQLGKWLSGEDDAAGSWLQRSGGPDLQPGIDLFLLEVEDVDSTPEPKFSMRVEVVSVGIDLKGGAHQPLIDIKGYRLGGIEARAFVGELIDGTLGFGGAGKFDDLGIPLGPGFGTHSGSNPVASSLLSSGTGKGGEAEKGSKDAVNPGFSLSAAYVSHGEFEILLYDAADQPAQDVWLPVQRAYGPLQIEKIGLGWEQKDTTFTFLIDGGVALAALKVTLDELSLGIPLEHPVDLDAYQLGLKGIGISFDAPPVQITGSFLEVETPGITAYEGEASVTVTPFGLSALGEYASVAPTNGEPGYTSLFLFAVLDAPIGGIPPYFFVTALAGGFGYNSMLTLPSMDAVQSFPLIAGLNDPADFFGDGDPKTGLAKLGSAVSPARGEYWLAAGIRFTSFELIHSIAMVSVEFGKELEIAVLGLSRMQLPQADFSFVYVELDIEILIEPDKGFFGASAILSPNSYVLAPACHLTGGFALDFWYDPSPHAGQFVLTIGGYNADFAAHDKPAYYPDVPRLGFDWLVGSTITIKGDAYFALTPTQLMGGGGLQILFHAGPIKAWFIAQLDVVIGWAPFHFLLHIEVELGVSLHIDFLFINITLSIELGGNLKVWGPPIGGTVTVFLFIFSITIGFGADENAGHLTIDWEEFQEKLLPKAKKKTPAGLSAGDADTSGTQDSNVVKIIANAGVIGKHKDAEDDTVWIVRPDHFEISTQTAVPATRVVTHGRTAYTGPDVSLRPMGLNKISSVHTVGIDGMVDGQPIEVDLNKGWLHEPAKKALPAATWGPGLTPQGTVKPEPIPGMITGLARIRPQAPILQGPSDINMKKAFTFFPVNENNEDHLPIALGVEPPSGAEPVHAGFEALKQIRNTIAATAVQTRNYVFAALLALGVDAQTNGSLAGFAADPTGALEATPWLGAPIVGGNS